MEGEKMGKIVISTTIEAGMYERIKKEKWRINELIEFAVACKDMDIRNASEVRERIEKISQLLDRTNKRLWELEGRFIDEIKKDNKEGD